jgi:hypothetical protein
MPSWVKTHAYKKAQTHGVQLPSAQSGLKASFFFRFWVYFSIFFVKIAKNCPFSTDIYNLFCARRHRMRG